MACGLNMRELVLEITNDCIYDCLSEFEKDTVSMSYIVLGAIKYHLENHGCSFDDLSESELKYIIKQVISSLIYKGAYVTFAGNWKKIHMNTKYGSNANEIAENIYNEWIYYGGLETSFGVYDVNPVSNMISGVSFADDNEILNNQSMDYYYDIYINYTYPVYVFGIFDCDIRFGLSKSDADKLALQVLNYFTNNRILYIEKTTNWRRTHTKKLATDQYGTSPEKIISNLFKTYISINKLENPIYSVEYQLLFV